MAELGPRSTLSRLLVVLSVLAVLVHLFGLYRPTGPPSPAWFPRADKVEHLVGFGAPVCLLLLARLSRRTGTGPAGVARNDPAAAPRRDRFPRWVVGIFAGHAVVSELVQHSFYRHRTGDPVDALADLAGVTLGWWVARLLARRVLPSGLPDPDAVPA